MNNNILYRWLMLILLLVVIIPVKAFEFDYKNVELTTHKNQKFISYDGGNTWEFNQPMPEINIFDKIVFSSNVNNRKFESIDNGNTWAEIDEIKKNKMEFTINVINTELEVNCKNLVNANNLKSDIFILDIYGNTILIYSNVDFGGYQTSKKYDIGSLKAGLYIINIKTGSHFYVNKFIFI